MDLLLESKNFISNQNIKISGSKSETNRVQLVQILFPDLIIENASDSDDSSVMKQCLQSNLIIKDVHHAGTAMRFLVSYYATQKNNEVVLTGSSRMKERPIQILVDALKQLDADISYVEKEGFPPLRIKGKEITKNQVEINADVSSQYISSLMLIAPALQNGLEIHLKGNITSVPYINMTLQILQTLGIEASFKENRIKILPTFKLKSNQFVVESDWSSASYFYSIMALSPINSQVTLSYFKQNSLQGDAVLAKIYQDFGVETIFKDDSIILTKVNDPIKNHVIYDLNNSPDIAQTIIVSCLGLGITCDLSGLHTLKIKETDRLQALKNELEKFGAEIEITNETIQLKNKVSFSSNIVEIATYQDHRMAMAFAPLAFKQKIKIKEAEVVSKSYPNFWNDMKQIGIVSQ